MKPAEIFRAAKVELERLEREAERFARCKSKLLQLGHRILDAGRLDARRPLSESELDFLQKLLAEVRDVSGDDDA